MESGTFFFHSEFTKRYKLNCNCLQYLQVVSAIPKRLLEINRQNKLWILNLLFHKITLFSAVIYNKVNFFEIEAQITIGYL